MRFSEEDGSAARNDGVRVTRPTYTWVNFGEKFEYHSEPGFSLGRAVRRWATTRCSPHALKNSVLRFFPFISIMANYNWKRNLMRDVIAGATVSAMHIPQGMAYGQLASLRPVHGLYVSFFPVLLYFFFGTSRQLSIGSFAVISLMVAKVLDGEVSKGFFPSENMTINGTEIISQSNNYHFEINSSSTATNFSSTTVSPSPEDREMALRVDLAVSLNLITGLIQILLGMLGAGFLTQYLSDPFISGYTTGCACHVFTSQLKYVFGVRIARHTGAFKIYETWRDVLINILETNYVTFAASVCAAAFLIVCKFVVDPRIKNISPMPIPAELILIIVANVCSYFANFGPEFNVQVVGPIPSNFPTPRIPVYFQPSLILDSIPLVFVSFSLCISMGKLFAKQYKYKIRPNQEFFAVGIANAVSSFFYCYTASASMSRSLVQANVGGQTQLAALVSCVIILSVILFLGTLLYPLPTCILAVVVMVNLRGMFLQAKDLKKYWRHCKLDAITWSVAFLFTVLIDVDIGLYVGVAFVLLTVIYQSARVRATVLRQAGNTEMFAQAKSYGNLSSTYPAVVVRWLSPIYFATVDKLVSTVIGAASLPITKGYEIASPSDESNSSTPGPSSGIENHGGELAPVKTVSFGTDEEPLDNLVISNSNTDKEVVPVLPSPLGSLTPRRSHNFHSRNEECSTAPSPSPSASSVKNVTAVILDLSGVFFVDTVGLEALKQLAQDLSSNRIDLLLASCPECLVEILATEESLQEFNRLNVFMSTVDALVAVRRGDLFFQFKPNGEVQQTLSPAANRSPVGLQRRAMMDSQTSLIQAQLDEEEGAENRQNESR